MAEDEAGSAASGSAEALRTAMKLAVSTLKADGVPFALGGGYALWVHGAPEPAHDVDVVVAEKAVEAAAASLQAADFRIERPPEDWLFKAHHGDALVDVLHRLQGVPVDETLLDRATEHEVLGLRMPVLPPTEIMVAKLQSLSEHYCDFGALLPVVRALREQLDWTELRSQSLDKPFAEAFLLLCDRLGIVPGSAPSSPGGAVSAARGPGSPAPSPTTRS